MDSLHLCLCCAGFTLRRSYFHLGRVCSCSFPRFYFSLKEKNMKTKCSCSIVRCGLMSVMVILLSACYCRSETPASTSAATDAPAANLVRAALENELAGHNDQREVLLNQAVDIPPMTPRPTGNWASPRRRRLAYDFASRTLGPARSPPGRISPAPRCGLSHGRGSSRSGKVVPEKQIL